MSLSKADHTTLGRTLYEAMRSEVPIKPLIQSHPDITIEDAYHVSRRFVSRRVEDGERIVGKKIGVTSAPVQEMLGVFQPSQQAHGRCRG